MGRDGDRGPSLSPPGSGAMRRGRTWGARERVSPGARPVGMRRRRWSPCWDRAGRPVTPTARRIREGAA
jgi:hypothetical protein